MFNGIENEESKWIPLSNIHDYKLISGLNDVLEVFEGTKYNEKEQHITKGLRA